MKPRLKSLPLTKEDFEIWWDRLHWGMHPYEIGSLGVACIDADRRDADLMLKLTKLSGMGPGLIGWHIISATCKLPYADIEAIVSEWIG